MDRDKKWSDLSIRQREWISQVAYEEQAAFVQDYGLLPMKKRKKPVIGKVMERLEARGICIPYEVAKPHIGKYIDRANRKSPLWNRMEDVFVKLRLEKKAAFFVSGDSVVTSEEALEKDCAMLRNKYEDKLRTVSDHLYFLSWANNEGAMVYHFCVATPNQEPATEGAVSVEVPAARFAIATVPEGANILASWHEFFDGGIPSLGVQIDMDYWYYCESFDKNGICELWIPVKE
jgi:predicted transcriptional regulator YdeE